MAPVPINEVKGTSRENRTAAHSHIKGLGLRSDGLAEGSGAGFIGQGAAREVYGLFFFESLFSQSIITDLLICRFHYGMEDYFESYAYARGFRLAVSLSIS